MFVQRDYNNLAINLEYVQMNTVEMYKWKRIALTYDPNVLQRVNA